MASMTTVCDDCVNGPVTFAWPVHGGNRFARGRDDLCLVAVRKDMGEIVLHHILGFGGDGWVGFKVGFS